MSVITSPKYYWIDKPLYEGKVNLQYTYVIKAKSTNITKLCQATEALWHYCRLHQCEWEDVKGKKGGVCLSINTLHHMEEARDSKHEWQR